MKVLLSLQLISLHLLVNTHAATWTVDSNTSRPADFRVIQEAVDAASSGDTILVAQSYENVNVDKRLNIIGKGYNLKENNIPNFDSSSLPTQIATISFKGHPDDAAHGGASGSVIEGMRIQHALIGASDDQYPVSNVTIKRCIVAGQVIAYSSNPVVESSDVNEILFLRQGGLVKNSLVQALFTQGVGCVMSHSIFTGMFSVGEYMVVENCIFLGASNPSAISVEPGYAFCLAVAGYTLPAGNGNINGAVAEDVFIEVRNSILEGITGNRYRLKEGSAAIGSGRNGVDMGIYGGPNPYVPSGIPSVPRITQIVMPAVVPDSTGLIFEVQAEARD